MINKLKRKLTKKEIIKLIPSIAIILVLVGFASYGFVKIDIQGRETIGITQNQNITLTFTEGSNNIELAYNPMDDTSGIAQNTYYDFTVNATSNMTHNMEYYIYLKDLGDSVLTANNIKVYLTKVEEGIETQVLAPTLISDLEEYIPESGVIISSKNLSFTNSITSITDTYRLRVWVDSNTELENIQTPVIDSTDDGVDITMSNISFGFKVGVSTKNNQSDIQQEHPNIDASGANEPLLTNNMIPVYYDIDASTWKKADSTNTNETYKWYDYDSKIWANAVTTTSTNRQNYIDASPGTPIPMSDINTMWVWIPRYTYTYFNTITPFEIQITFENGTNSSGTISCTDATSGGATTVSQTCTDATNGSLVAGTSTYTHPAFTLGEQELTGLWIGKFQNGGTSQTINIKPNIVIWTNANVSTFFKTMRNMEQGENAYGFPQANSTTYNNTGVLTNDNNNIDTHMIKNIEWGAVAYLSHTRYGINEEVFVNNSTSLYAGRSYGAAADGTKTSSAAGSYEYDNPTYGYKASTSGNIYGIYDMAGAAWQYIMGNIFNSSNAFNTQSAGSFAPLSKYYDAYTSSTSTTTYSRGKLGDATIELAPAANASWYSDYAELPTDTNSWFRRGGSSTSGADAGIFYYRNNTGTASAKYSSRAILAIWPTN